MGFSSASVRLLGAVVALSLAGAGCGISRVHHGAALQRSARWAMLPLENHSETPMAAERVEAIVPTLLRSRGVGDIVASPASDTDDPLTLPSDRQRLEASLAWAKKSGVRYGVSGSVTEWRYKSGLDGEPSVGITLQVIDMASGRVLWSGVGARTGWARDNVSSTAVRVVEELLDQVVLSP